MLTCGTNPGSTDFRTFGCRIAVRKGHPVALIVGAMKQELDSRTNSHGDVVVLAWYPGTDQLEIEVTDGHLGFVRSAPVPKACALDAFRHPYLYLESTVALAA
jgi:hypothetical protein